MNCPAQILAAGHISSTSVSNNFSCLQYSSDLKENSLQLFRIFGCGFLIISLEFSAFAVQIKKIVMTISKVLVTILQNPEECDSHLIQHICVSCCLLLAEKPHHRSLKNRKMQRHLDIKLLMRTLCISEGKRKSKNVHQETDLQKA